MDSKAEIKSQIAHGLHDPADTEERGSSRPSDSVGHEVNHSFSVDSNIADDIVNGEARLFNTSNGMVIEDEDIDEEDIEGESSQANKSFSCVDYLEIMHGEMLNPEAGQVSESDAPEEEDSDYICKNPHCDFSTTDMEAYLKHEYEHTDGKSYQCDVCNMKFNMFSSMRSHRMLHLSHRPYKCRLCSKEFVRKDVLLEHLVKQHSKQRPYRCPFCPKHFKLRLHLKMHLSNEHSAAMLIKTCKLCGFKATSLNAFRSHLAICYMKRSFSSTDVNECNVSPISLVSSEANTIDFGAVSRNFSFVPSHYPPPYALVASDSTHPIPGPSDLTQVVSLHTTTPAVCSISSGKTDLDPCTGEANICRVSSLASSTTAAGSPNTNHPGNDEGPQNLVIGSVGTFVKSEPPELRGEDSQNGNALPTSTMDLSAANVVETSYSCNEASCCQTTPELQMKVRVSPYHGKHHVESYEMPTAESATSCCSDRRSTNYSVSKIRGNSSSKMAKSNVCQCHSSDMRSEDQHCGSSGKRERHSDSTTIREAHGSSKRSCRDMGTVTELFSETASQQDLVCRRSSCAHDGYPRSSTTTTSAPAAATNSDNCSDTKSGIGLKNIEGGSFTCPYCEITFPDQTLYFLHRSLHSEAHPWKCNLCGKIFRDKYDFNSHIISQGHH